VRLFKFISMKITKIPFDGLGIYLTATVNLFFITFFITFRNLDTDGLVFDLFQSVAILAMIAQNYNYSFMRLFRRKKRYSAVYPQLDLKSGFNIFLLMIAPIGILILLKWKVPASSEYVLWVVSAIGIFSIIYLFFKNRNVEFDEQEPYFQLIDSKKYLTFLQRNFSVEILKEEIRSLEIDSEKKTLTVDIGEKKVFKMPFHLRDEFEHMHFYFPNDQPHWFVEN